MGVLSGADLALWAVAVLERMVEKAATNENYAAIKPEMVALRAKLMVLLGLAERTAAAGVYPTEYIDTKQLCMIEDMMGVKYAANLYMWDNCVCADLHGVEELMKDSCVASLAGEGVMHGCMQGVGLERMVGGMLDGVQTACEDAALMVCVGLCSHGLWLAHEACA